MKISVRLFLLSVVALAALALNACSGAQAAPGSSSGIGLNDLSSTDVVSTASVNSNDVLLGTATPDVSGTPSSAETPSVSETHTANELVGVVTAMDATTITINGVVYNLADLPSFAGTLKVGDTVKLEFITNADGTITVREIKISSGSDSISNSNDNNSNDHSPDINDNGNSNDSNSNDHSPDVNGNGNSNSHDDNSNDSHNGNSNENEHGMPVIIATP